MDRLPAVGPWLRRYLIEYMTTQRNLAINTQKSYRDTFKQLLSYISDKSCKAIERLRMDDISAAHVLAFLSHVENQRHCSVQTRNLRLNAIRSFARYVAARDPACIEWAASIRQIETKKASPQPLNWLSRDEVNALIAVPDTSKPRGRMEHALLLFLFNTGARASEAVALNVGDLQLTQTRAYHAKVTLHGKGGKTRQCSLWPETEQALAAVIEGKHKKDAVFISRLRQPYTRSGVYRMVERCAAAVASLNGRKVTPHVIRHYLG